MFSQFHPKATKSRYKGAFSFTLRESRLLEKRFFMDLVLWFGFWLLGGKSQTKHTLRFFLFWVFEYPFFNSIVEPFFNPIVAQSEHT
jgi:hypothetical protein